MSNAEETLETIESMTPVKKTKEKVETQGASEKDPAEERRSSLAGQSTQLEATFTLDKVEDRQMTFVFVSTSSGMISFCTDRHSYRRSDE